MLFYFFQVEKKIVSTEIGVLLKMDHPNIVSQIKFPGVSCGQSEGGRRGGRGSVEKEEESEEEEWEMEGNDQKGHGKQECTQYKAVHIKTVLYTNIHTHSNINIFYFFYRLKTGKHIRL